MLLEREQHQSVLLHVEVQHQSQLQAGWNGAVSDKRQIRSWINIRLASS